jgi:hypothetical protein
MSENVFQDGVGFKFYGMDEVQSLYKKIGSSYTVTF